MDSQTLMIGPSYHLSGISSRRRRGNGGGDYKVRMESSPTRRVFHHGEAFCFMMVLFHIIIILAKGESCSMKGQQNQAEYDACMSYKPNEVDGFSGDLSSGFVLENPVPRQSLDSVCSHTDLFCFPSRLRGFLFEEKNAQSQVEEVSGVQSDVDIGSDEEDKNLSRSSDSCIFKFLGGRTISCYLSYQECYSELPCSCIRRNRQNGVSFGEVPLSDDKCQKLKPKAEDETDSFNILGISSPHVEINPPLLDWGEKYLYFPSLAFLNIKNTHSDRTLTVFEPYGTNSQFYPCNFSETLLAPGETASICFVFLPTWLGFSAAQFVLQTSFGGFLVQAKGFAVESPYRIQPLVSLDISSSGRLSKNLSLYNPYNEALYVEEVTIWTSISSGDNTRYAKAICNMNKGEDSNNNFSLLGVKEWLDVKGDEVGIPLVAIRPHRNWEIDPDKTETIIELDFPSHTRGEIFGAFSLQLLSSSKGKADTIIVPLKAELGKMSAHSELTDPLFLSIQTVKPCATDGTSVVALSVRNDSPYILSIVKVSEAGENIKYFRVRYVEGLILFPSTVTQVAVVTYSSPSVQLDPLVQAHEMSMNCKLLVSTNDSRTSEIEVTCMDVVSLCSGGKYDTSIGQEEHSDEVELGNTRAISSSSSMRSPLESKAVDTTMADESVLKNWKSHATANGMSVLDESEVVFPVIQVGSYHSQWITIENPSQKPILVQLVLNSWEIIDECKTSGSHLQPSLSSRIVANYSIAPKRYGFSLAENAVTEALLHPFSKASFGPILFQPAARCQWRSSALLRNNLSGVEWLTLKGSGGLLSLVLLDASEPVQNLEFKLNMSTPLNLSSSDVLYNMKDKFHACSLSLSKELHAKNVGDFPLEVKKIEISGTECGTDGFVINGCKGFSLEPEESIKLVISYHTDFSAATIHRDLELALATGILVIPMKASLPICVLHFCKRSLFWTRVKKLLVTILFLTSLFFLVIWCIIPQVVAFGSHECLPKSGKSYMTSVSHTGKLSRMHPTEKQIGKFLFSFKLNGLLRSIGEGEALSVESFSTCEDIQAVSQNLSVTDQNVNHCAGYNSVSDTQKGMEVSSSAKSVAIQSSNIYETSKAGNLTVKIAKEKGRRRKKRKNSTTALVGVFDVSSSHSGNSTPSSPLSPTSNSTPRRPSPQSADVDRPVKLINSFADVGNHQCKKSIHPEFVSQRNVLQREVTLTDGGKNSCPPQEKPAAPKRSASKPVLLPSATFPCADKSAPRLMCRQPVLASSSVIAPHLRAPGSKPPNQMAVKTDEKMGMEEKFTYDIWGDHLSNLPLVGRSKEVLETPPCALENSSSSFFLRGPQTLITNYQQITVSSDREG
ncbi:hypothetical protein MTR67_011768 [Solanum verrucosum]|uniref:Transmembrane protein 131-like N-terminal domain-containing protein n=1 Tax=Solanum verrucosum TaxID=315347 RepID=A0AAF0TJI9_SOLVR|nr:hypothetical protein MTR67_011768 [Solanum verrucosum]